MSSSAQQNCQLPSIIPSRERGNNKFHDLKGKMHPSPTPKVDETMMKMIEVPHEFLLALADIDKAEFAFKSIETEEGDTRVIGEDYTIHDTAPLIQFLGSPSPKSRERFWLPINVMTGQDTQRPLLALLDTGADDNCINAKVAEKFVPRQYWRRSRGLWLDGSHVHSLGTISLEFRAKEGKKYFDEILYILEDLPVEMLLGIPWLGKHKYLKEDRSVLPIRRLTGEQQAAFDMTDKENKKARDAAREEQRRLAAEERERQRADAASRRILEPTVVPKIG